MNRMSRARRESVSPCPDPDDIEAARRVALQSLDAADQSSLELIARLRHRGFSADCSAAAVSTMVEYGYVNDTALGQSIAARGRRRGYGARRISADLKARGLETAQPDDTEQAAADERDRVVELAGRLWRQQPGAARERARARLARALIRRGFSTSDVACALRGLAQESGDSDR